MIRRTPAIVVVLAVFLPTALSGARELVVHLQEQQTPPLAVIPEDLDLPAKAIAQGPTFEEQMVELVNQQRWDYNNGHLPPLKMHAQLNAAAEGHSQRMAVGDFFSHCDLDTFTLPADRVAAQGYSAVSVAENAAAGTSTPSATMGLWMNSPGHRNNILTLNNREIGIGYYDQIGDAGNVRTDANSDCSPESFGDGPYRHYWTQNFGARSGGYPVVINREAYETTSRTVDLYLYGTGWASEMRIRNDCGSFGSWQAFSADVTGWELCSGNGEREVFVEIRNGGTVRSASDTILLNAPLDVVFTDGFESGDMDAWSP
jgi:uncharacterized protein YkwD